MQQDVWHRLQSSDWREHVILVTFDDERWRVDFSEPIHLLIPLDTSSVLLLESSGVSGL